MVALNFDIVYAGKNVYRSYCNWFMFIERARFSFVMLRIVRFDLFCLKDLKVVLTDVVLRGRDRMDTSYVVECNGVNVEKVLLRMGYFVYIVVSEMFWKEYGFNKFGVLFYLILVCCGVFGLFYIVDYIFGFFF